jgi:ArsR family transcriptional regulator, arsenate/arsenite/antimonite-responsive transcriptional repressor
MAMNPKKAEKISKALADPNRLLILKEIKKQRDCMYCSDLNEIVDLAQPSIAHHLKLLTDTEIITSEKEGRHVKYSLNNQVIDEYIAFLQSLKK